MFFLPIRLILALFGRAAFFSPDLSRFYKVCLLRFVFGSVGHIKLKSIDGEVWMRDQRKRLLYDKQSPVDELNAFQRRA